MKNLIVIMGPTSSGKTSLALTLCAKYKASIISADSRQVYRYMDIGTGKLPVGHDCSIQRHDDRWVINDINIWGYDLVNPDVTYSAYDFTLFSLNKIRQVFKDNDLVFLVGGTGFYIDSVLGEKKLSDVKPDMELRESLSLLSTPQLSEKLKQLNRSSYDTTDLNNRVRLIRAIEREKSGIKQQNTIEYLKDIRVLKIGLNSDRSVVFSRADSWVSTIWANGLLQEVEKLTNMGYANTPRMQSLIYATTLEYLAGITDEKNAQERIKFDIHAYIRRQLTWFRKGKDITWFDIADTDYMHKVYNFIDSKI